MVACTCIHGSGTLGLKSIGTNLLKFFNFNVYPPFTAPGRLQEYGKLISKTAAKAKYGLTDAELKSLGTVERKNPHNKVRDTNSHESVHLI